MKTSLLYSTIEQHHVDMLMPIEQACHSHPWSEKTLRSCIGGRYFGSYAEITSAEAENDTIGFYIGEYILGEATLMDICVAPSQQGQGFGKALISHFIEQAVALGAEKIWLEVRASNTAAIMLYINQSFIETGRRTGYYPKEVGYEDAIVMCKYC
ncbi:ribosomal protein S18-alanine N-acetyltransferase [Colwellia sp. MEBiC06753]